MWYNSLLNYITRHLLLISCNVLKDTASIWYSSGMPCSIVKSGTGLKVPASKLNPYNFFSIPI